MKKLRYFLAVLLLTGTASAEVYRLTPSRSAEVQTVLDKLVEGDTVVFDRGIYRTHSALVLREKIGVELRSNGRVEIVLDNLDDAVLEIQGCQNVRITGLRARHQKPNEEYQCEGAVIAVRDSQQVGISRCELNGCGAAGVYATSVKDLIVFDNKIFNNSFAGVWVSDTTGHVYKNHLHHNASDFITYGESDIVLSANKIEKNDGNEYVRGDFFDVIVHGR